MEGVVPGLGYIELLSKSGIRGGLSAGCDSAGELVGVGSPGRIAGTRSNAGLQEVLVSSVFCVELIRTAACLGSA